MGSERGAELKGDDGADSPVAVEFDRDGGVIVVARVDSGLPALRAHGGHLRAAR